jgi:transcriptional regulator with XRE-family HTH domain
MKEDPKIIGSRLKQAREQAGWTVPSLAEAIGFKPIALYDAHYGKNKPALDKIAEFLHINPAWLETGHGEIFLTPPPEAPAKRKPGPRKPRAARAQKAGHPLTNQVRPEGPLGKKYPPKLDLLGALQRASRAAEAFQAAKDELDAALADLDTLRA